MSDSAASDRIRAASLRPCVPADETFLYDVYASTRADEMRLVPWSDEEKTAFVQMQFTAQRTSYLQYNPDAQWSIILRDDVPIGRLIVDRPEHELLLMDIALLPDYRGQGLGSALILDLLDEAQRKNIPLRLHVEYFNPALRLYQRLGFKPIGETGVYYEMEWRPTRDVVH